MAREIIYEPHPVSPERKAELQAKGFRIVDARFAPPEAKKAPKVVEAAPAPEPVEVAPVEVVAEPAPAVEAPKRGRPPKVAPEPQISDKAETSSEG